MIVATVTPIAGTASSPRLRTSSSVIPVQLSAVFRTLTCSVAAVASGGTRFGRRCPSRIPTARTKPRCRTPNSQSEPVMTWTGDGGAQGFCPYTSRSVARWSLKSTSGRAPRQSATQTRGRHVLRTYHRAHSAAMKAGHASAACSGKTRRLRGRFQAPTHSCDRAQLVATLAPHSTHTPPSACTDVLRTHNWRRAAPKGATRRPVPTGDRRASIRSRRYTRGRAGTLLWMAFGRPSDHRESALSKIGSGNKRGEGFHPRHRKAHVIVPESRAVD